MPKRSRESRNPRVKHKEKFRRALKKRRSLVSTGGPLAATRAGFSGATAGRDAAASWEIVGTLGMTFLFLLFCYPLHSLPILNRGSQKYFWTYGLNVFYGII